MRLAIILAVLTSVQLAAPARAEQQPAPAQEKSSTISDVKEGVRDGTRSVGHFFRDTTKAIGHGFRDAGRAVGKGARDAANATGEAASETWDKVTK